MKTEAVNKLMTRFHILWEYVSKHQPFDYGPRNAMKEGIVTCVEEYNEIIKWLMATGSIRPAGSREVHYGGKTYQLALYTLPEEQASSSVL